MFNANNIFQMLAQRLGQPSPMQPTSMPGAEQPANPAPFPPQNAPTQPAPFPLARAVQPSAFPGLMIGPQNANPQSPRGLEAIQQLLAGMPQAKPMQMPQQSSRFGFGRFGLRR